MVRLIAMVRVRRTAVSSWRHRLRQRWLRRLTAPLEAPLSQRHLFLLPTGFGLTWLVLVLVLLLFAINYRNSLAYALAFWLFALAVVSLLRGWRNLLGLRVALRAPGEVFAGGEARLGVKLAGGRPRAALELHGGGVATRLDLPEGQGETIHAWPVERRGVQALPRLRLESRWPLGLVRVVTWLDPDSELLVYPRPLADDGGMHRAIGAGLESGDFAGLRRAVPGDSPAHLAWKQWSRTGVLAAKVFDLPPRESLWLDYAACRGDPETRLSRLCARVLAHHRAGDRYGLRLPGTTLPPGSGSHQRRAALAALAYFDLPSAGAPESAR